MFDLNDVKKSKIVCTVTGVLGIVSFILFVFWIFAYLNNLNSRFDEQISFFDYIGYFNFTDYAKCLGMFISIAFVFVKKFNVQNIIFTTICALYIVYFVDCFLYSLTKLSDNPYGGLHILYIIVYILFVTSVIVYAITHFLSDKIIKTALKISKICIVVCIIISIISHIALSYTTNNIPVYIDFIFIQCGIYIWFYPRNFIKRKPKNISPADMIQSEIDQLDKEFAFGNISQEEYQDRKNAIIDKAIK